MRHRTRCDQFPEQQRSAKLAYRVLERAGSVHTQLDARIRAAVALADARRTGQSTIAGGRASQHQRLAQYGGVVPFFGRTLGTAWATPGRFCR